MACGAAPRGADAGVLFPCTVGGFRTTNVFKKVFDDVCSTVGRNEIERAVGKVSLDGGLPQADALGAGRGCIGVAW